MLRTSSRMRIRTRSSPNRPESTTSPFPTVVCNACDTSAVRTSKPWSTSPRSALRTWNHFVDRSTRTRPCRSCRSYRAVCKCQSPRLPRSPLSHLRMPSRRNSRSSLWQRRCNTNTTTPRAWCPWPTPWAPPIPPTRRITKHQANPDTSSPSNEPPEFTTYSDNPCKFYCTCCVNCIKSTHN